jgi:DNA-binding response OmpR family regulator
MYYAKQSGKAKYCFADETFEEISNIEEKYKIVLSEELYWDAKDSLLIYKEEEIYLTKNETLFLASLFNHPNYRATYETIYTYIWGISSEIKIGRMKTLVKVLRKKLPSNIIKNIFAIGYKINTQ